MSAHLRLIRFSLVFNYLPVRNIVPRIFEHVLPCRTTTLKFSRVAFSILVIFLLLPDSTIFVYRSQRSKRGEFRPCVTLHPKRQTSDSVELCDTHVCFLHIHLIGTYVWLPIMHNGSYSG